jgi:hypothetical protein
MRRKLVPIGKARGVALPRSYITRSGLGAEVDVQLGANCVILRPVNAATRAGWDEAFARMRKRGDDALLDVDAPPSNWDRKEWRW